MRALSIALIVIFCTPAGWIGMIIAGTSVAVSLGAVFRGGCP